MADGKTVKTVYITLPPGDSGPICSYSPFCSPGDQDLAFWRQATITLVETQLVPKNEDRELINTWILQLVRRELTVALQQAERELHRPLEIAVSDGAAEVIRRARELRVAGLEPRVAAPKKGKELELRIADLEIRIANLTKG